jgi:class 3 adenylate cyclase
VARLQRRRFSEPDDAHPVGEHGTVEIVELDDRAVGRITYQPGWRYSTDVGPITGTKTCPAHHVGFTLSGRLRIQMADGIELELGPGEVFEIPPGHDMWVVGDEPWVSVDFEQGLGRVARRRQLASILMTDIVDSTARAVAIGRTRWRELVGRHNEIAERAIDQRGGRLIKTTGDGMLATFDSTEQAVQAAVALRDSIHHMGIDIRAGVQTGEVELVAGDVRGLAVHTAARLLATAGRGEVVVTSIVRELLVGTDLLFEDHGRHRLKGLPGELQLFRVVVRAPRTVPPASAH